MDQGIDNVVGDDLPTFSVAAHAAHLVVYIFKRVHVTLRNGQWPL